MALPVIENCRPGGRVKMLPTCHSGESGHFG
jgi:hypothetical protein